MIRLVSCASTLLLAALAAAADPPTPARVNEVPAAFVGRTLTFDRVELSGDTQRLPGRYGFTVKAGEAEFKPVPDGLQRVRFATADQGEAVRKALAVFKPGSTHLARLTARLEKVDRNDYVATVTRIDLIRFDDDRTAGTPVPVAVTPEEVAKDHRAFAGKWVVFDGVRLTTDVADGPARVQVGMKSAAGTEYPPPAGGGGRGFRFSLPGKGSLVKTYLETRWKDDVGHPLRVVCQIAEPNGTVAVIRRIDRVVELPAGKTTAGE